jgi:hypothetical protein
MSKYQNSKIYKLVSPHTDEIYIGSTTQRLCHRLSGHKSDCKKIKNKSTSSKLFELGEVKIILIEECPCDNKEQLLKRERHHIENNKCLNKCIPGRTVKEYYDDNKEKIKEYYQNNKEKIKEYSQEYRENNKYDKKYYEKNKDKIIKRKSEKATCDCGSTFRRNDKTRHEKTIKHQSYLSNK